LAFAYNANYHVSLARSLSSKCGIFTVMPSVIVPSVVMLSVVALITKGVGLFSNRHLKLVPQHLALRHSAK
jgi:hypothetical protein